MDRWRFCRSDCYAGRFIFGVLVFSLFAQSSFAACESLQFRWRTEYDVIALNGRRTFLELPRSWATYQDQYCGDQWVTSYFAGGAITFLNLRLATRDSVAAFVGASFRMSPSSMVVDSQQNWITSYLDVPVFDTSAGHHSLDRLSIMTSKFSSERPFSVIRLKSGDELSACCR